MNRRQLARLLGGVAAATFVPAAPLCAQSGRAVIMY
jgi:hypothetical protein